jgi:hypothetical protein
MMHDENPEQDYHRESCPSMHEHLDDACSLCGGVWRALFLAKLYTRARMDDGYAQKNKSNRHLPHRCIARQRHGCGVT